MSAISLGLRCCSLRYFSIANHYILVLVASDGGGHISYGVINFGWQEFNFINANVCLIIVVGGFFGGRALLREILDSPPRVHQRQPWLELTHSTQSIRALVLGFFLPAIIFHASALFVSTRRS